MTAGHDPTRGVAPGYVVQPFGLKSGRGLQAEGLG